MSWIVEPAGAHVRDAFALVLRMLPATERAAAVDRAMGLLERGELRRDGVWIARQSEQVIGAVVAMPLAGGAGLLWPPQAADGMDAAAIEDAVTTAALGWLRQQGTRMCQVLLRDEERDLGLPLLRHGFVRTTELVFLRCWLDGMVVGTPDDAAVEWTSWQDCSAEVFQRTLIDTYQDSLDCPELDGVRTIDEIIAGHQAQGRFDPDYWWLMRWHGEAAGVLLLNGIVDEPAWEIVYLGLCPRFRGIGMGQTLVAKALEEARLTRARFVDVTVDVRNAPARNLYRHNGFVMVDKRDVFLRIEPKTTAVAKKTSSNIS